MIFSVALIMNQERLIYDHVFDRKVSEDDEIGWAEKGWVGGR